MYEVYANTLRAKACETKQDTDDNKLLPILVCQGVLMLQGCVDAALIVAAIEQIQNGTQFEITQMVNQLNEESTIQ